MTNQTTQQATPVQHFVPQPLPLGRIICGDNIATMRTFPDASIDAIVTDPPYGLSFMGKKWDYDVPSVECWAECLRVLKPGGHLLAFAGTRTQHRMACRIEDAGFEIRDMIAWVYGSGFPKSLDVSKAIDKAAGAEREVVGPGQYANRGRVNGTNQCSVGDSLNTTITAPATEAAKQWDGFGTALKPALEPITMARKPIEGTIAGNVLKHGVGGINVDGCRIKHDEPEVHTNLTSPKSSGEKMGMFAENGKLASPSPAGRFPANLIHDGSDEVLGLFPETTSGMILPHHKSGGKEKGIYGQMNGLQSDMSYGDSGSAARFFYTAKASKSDRGHGNNHPTVKPTDLMRYLVRLVCPIGGIVLDPFNGSGATTYAARAESCRYIGIELNPEYVEISEKRLMQQVLF